MTLSNSILLQRFMERSMRRHQSDSSLRFTKLKSNIKVNWFARLVWRKRKKHNWKTWIALNHLENRIINIRTILHESKIHPVNVRRENSRAVTVSQPFLKYGCLKDWGKLWKMCIFSDYKKYFCVPWERRKQFSWNEHHVKYADFLHFSRDRKTLSIVQWMDGELERRCNIEQKKVDSNNCAYAARRRQRYSQKRGRARESKRDEKNISEKRNMREFSLCYFIKVYRPNRWIYGKHTF